VMRHMLHGKNLALITTRQTRDKWDAFAARLIIGHKSLAAYDINNLFPLYLYDDSAKQADKGRRPNLSPEFVSAFSQKLRLKFVEDGRGDLKKTFGPEDVFDYIYAVFHSPTYRSRYAEFLKIDFPRVPLTSNVELFRKLVKLGGKLVKLHLLEDETLETSAVKYPVGGEHIIEKVRYVDIQRQVWINKKQYFEGVPHEVWEFHIGGYQVAQKWLKDRKGRTLSSDDREHYRKIIAALAGTIRLMQEIDKVIPKWPIE
ncbi:MAG: type ISP restriction/modification enzyme, partial [bacterium]